jgi:hypothetical protein
MCTNEYILHQKEERLQSILNDKVRFRKIYGMLQFVEKNNKGSDMKMCQIVVERHTRH